MANKLHISCMRFLLSIGSLMLTAMHVFSQESLRGCIFRTYDFRIIQLSFYDDEHCACTQSFYFPMPGEPLNRTDTLLYHTDGYRLILENPAVPTDKPTEEKKCENYLMYGFGLSRFINRDGTALQDYPITPLNYINRKMAASVTHWIDWGGIMTGTFESQDILSLFGRRILLYRVAGNTAVETSVITNSISEDICQSFGYDFPCDEELTFRCHVEYRWFTREESTLPTSETLSKIVGKKYIYLSDTIFFRDHSCLVFTSDSLQRNCTYEVTGPYIIVHNMVEPTSAIADTLVYDNKVIYYSSVTQSSNVLDQTGVDVAIGWPRPTALSLHPTAKMQTCAYTQENEAISDEQIGKTFQRLYMPINFHIIQQ